MNLRVLFLTVDVFFDRALSLIWLWKGGVGGRVGGGTGGSGEGGVVGGGVGGRRMGRRIKVSDG